MSGRETNWHGGLFLSLLLAVLVMLPSPGWSQLARGKSKFLGNALSSSIPVWPNYGSLWNQVTPGNAGKWGSVEGSMDNYNWGPLDDIYTYALISNMQFKYHCLVWGNQQPSWITAVDTATQRAQVEEWIRLAGEKYTYTSAVDVVNEPFHAVPSYANALGGAGQTGWDWVITSFQYARKYFLKGTKLILNEYSILHDNTATSNLLALVDTLRVRGLIDAIGIQGHSFEFKGTGYTHAPTTIKANLRRLTATGLPVYISEFDINEPNDSLQLYYYQRYFPIFWEEPGVKGITFWGYMQGDMWQVNAFLIRSDGTERPALRWLRRYIESPLPPVLISPSGTTGEPRNPLLVWHASALAARYRVQVSTNSLFTSNVLVDSTVADTVLKINPLAANTRFYWRANAINDSGPGSFSDAVVFTTGDQILVIDELEGKPFAFVLEQNYPNPFNSTTVISSRLPVASRVKLAVYDLLGREVALLFNGWRGAGTYHDTFPAEGQGSPPDRWRAVGAGGVATGLASGVYVYRLTSGSFVASRRMIMIR